MFVLDGIRALFGPSHMRLQVAVVIGALPLGFAPKRHVRWPLTISTDVFGQALRMVIEPLPFQ